MPHSLKMPWDREAVRVLPAKIDLTRQPWCRGDSRLKGTALRCAAVWDHRCSLKGEAFQVLAGLKGDPDVEAFFIDYFVNLEEPSSVHGSIQDDLTGIAHSFWE